MKIGITERGDAGLDFSWFDKLSTVDGAILITKNVNNSFIEKVLTATKPLIVHATCTGLGGTSIEPAVPSYTQQLNGVKSLIERGFPKDHIVLRIDPIIPRPEYLSKIKQVLDTAFELGLLPNMRVRISLLDEYPHVRKRFYELGIPSIYHGDFQPTPPMCFDAMDLLESYDINYESCAEPMLISPKITATGCVSPTDLKIMGYEVDSLTINPQNRRGCRCLACKTELLEHRGQCPHKCAYCYWKG